MPGNLVCPLCGVSTSLSPLWLIGRGILEKDFGSDDVHYIDVVLRAITDNHCMDMSSKDVGYAILTCQACDGWFVAKKQRHGTEWLAIYPIPHKPVAQEIPEPIKSEFGEASLCFAIGAYKACVSMCMTALESLWRQQNASGLNDLKEKGIISSRLFAQATEIRLWADIVKHELIHELVTKEETEELLTYLEEILHDVYVRPARQAALAEKREQIEQLKKGTKPESS